MKPDRTDRIMGAVFGILLCILWILIVLFVEGRLYPDQNLVKNPLISWVNIGLIPFLAVAGNHLIYYRKLGGVETAQSLAGLKSYLAGFAIWAVVIGFFLMDSGISYMTLNIVGFLFIIAIVLIYERKVKRDYRNNETGGAVPEDPENSGL